jgi:glycosyltransferase involved in cell wall biosynthesis
VNIIFVAACPFLEDRGTPLRIEGLARALADANHSVEIVCYHLGRNPDNAPYRICRLPHFPFYKKTAPGPSPLKPLVDLFLYAKTFSRVHSNSPDVIVGSHVEGGLIGAFLKLSRGIPFFYDAHASFADEMKAFRYLPDVPGVELPFDGLESFIARQADAIGAVSETLKNHLGERTTRDVPVSHLPNGIRLNDFENPRDRRAELGIPRKNFLVVFVGNLSPYQGIEYLLEAAEQLDESVQFLVVGDPKERYEEKSHNRGLGDRITFTGQVPFTEVPDYLASGDCLVAPRIGTATDGQQASKLMHYLAAGKPIVATDIRPHDVLKDNETALLIEDESPESIADAIGTLQSNPNLRERLSRNAKKKSHEYDWSRSGEKILDLLNRSQVDNFSSSR